MDANSLWSTANIIGLGALWIFIIYMYRRDKRKQKLGLSKEDENKMHLDALYTIVLETYGERNQITKARDELSELYNELHYYLYTSPYNQKAILDEVADVYNMLAQLQMIFKFRQEDIDERRYAKMKRTLDRMSREG